MIGEVMGCGVRLVMAHMPLRNQGEVSDLDALSLL